MSLGSLLLLLLLTAGGVTGYRNSANLGQRAVDDANNAEHGVEDAVTSAYLQGLQDGAKSKPIPSSQSQEANAGEAAQEREGSEKDVSGHLEVGEGRAARLAEVTAQQQRGQVPDTIAIAGDSGNAYYGGEANWEYPKIDNHPLTWKEWFFAIGGGTGASVSPTGESNMDQDLLRRMRYQDKAVMGLLLLAYAGALLFSATISYRQASNDSPVTYYADPRFHTLTTDAEDVESFLDTFNQPPKNTHLQVTGLTPLPALPEYMVDATSLTWLGARYRICFSFSLDLSPWLVHDGTRLDDQENYDSTMGVDSDEMERLVQYLANDSNDLSFVEMEQVVAWKDWEELATNIKTKIRQAGFTGVVDVRRNAQEVVTVHKNKTWANFAHSRTTKVLLALSVVGWFVYQPYMWIRHRAIQVKCRYRVDVGIGQYWPLISEKIGPDGFDNGMSGNVMQVPRPSRQQRQSHQQQLAEHLETSRW